MSPDIETFLGPEMAMSAASAIWAQKSRFCYGGGGGVKIFFICNKAAKNKK